MIDSCLIWIIDHDGISEKIGKKEIIRSKQKQKKQGKLPSMQRVNLYFQESFNPIMIASNMKRLKLLFSVCMFLSVASKYHWKGEKIVLECMLSNSD